MPSQKRDYTLADIPTYADILDREGGNAPRSFYVRGEVDYGTDDISVERYLDPHFHELEVERLWKRVWQWACFEDDIPEPGDFVTYDIAGISIIITRSAPGKLSAFYNSCLHRGITLVEGEGKAKRFVCPFHGWTYGPDGTLERLPASWDFPGLCTGRDGIRQVKVESYDGLVFINMDQNAGPLADHLGVLPKFLSPYPGRSRLQRTGWVRKVCPGNWKNAMEAFQEGYHLPLVHHQFRHSLTGVESRADVLDRNISRLSGPSSVPNLVTGPDISEQELLDYSLRGFTTGKAGSEVPEIKLAEGQSAREVLADLVRGQFAAMNGLDLSQVSDAEVLDHELFHVFPNSVVWGSWTSPIMYRWRPNGNDHTSCIMDLVMFVTHPEGADIPAPAPVHHLSMDEDFASAPELGSFGPLIDQDVANLHRQASGLPSTPEAGLKYGNDCERLIRHFHHRLAQVLGGDASNPPRKAEG